MDDKKVPLINKVIASTVNLLDRGGFVEVKKRYIISALRIDYDLKPLLIKSDGNWFCICRECITIADTPTSAYEIMRQKLKSVCYNKDTD